MLEEYKRKRNFEETPEPKGGAPVGEGELSFVVQKHHASHLHYDFRLELKGVLKSWAVPKGPSMDHSVKRLAMLVEDHPWDYRNFEGIIPIGYGKGTVMVWDRGTYVTPKIESKDKKEQEHSLTSQFWQGKMVIRLQGEKLKGDFALFKVAKRGENAWLLQKMDDEYASKEEITRQDRSVLTERTLEEIKQSPSKEWQNHKGTDDGALPKLLRQGIESKAPAVIKPMAATLIREPFEDADWSFELKIDGYRVVAFVSDTKVKLQSRGGQDYTSKYGPVVDELRKMPLNAVLDGEMAVPDETGKPNFDALQNYDGSQNLIYYVFDVLWANGYDLTKLPYTIRRSILSSIITPSEVVKISETFEDGPALFAQVKQMGLEGIVAKRKTSAYTPGQRSRNWLKLPVEKRQEFVVGGWTESDEGRPFRSLLFGAYEKDGLRYIGHAGSGFSEKQMKEVLKELLKREISSNPFTNEPDAKTAVHFAKPNLIANFKISGWTAGGKIRKPAVFLGFRDDKAPEEVMVETPLSIETEKEIVENEPAAKREKPAREPAPESNWHLLKEEKITGSDSVHIDDKEVFLTNIDKQLWKDIPKASLIEYYHRMAPYILPHLKDRPLSLHIKNINAGAPGFYIKDMEGNEPAWAKVFSVERKHKSENKSSIINYLVCNDEATLIYMINLGCIDVNPWTSRIGNYLQPDFLIVDLDPSDEDFEKVIHVGRSTKKVLDRLKLTGFPKTSGKTGIHIYIPCTGFRFGETRPLAKLICQMIETDNRDIATTENAISKRGNKVFLDYNQNDEADTVAAAYSIRPFHRPTISTPLEWKEIKIGLDPGKFLMENMEERIEQKGELFFGCLDPKIAEKNRKILRKLLEK